MCELVHEGAFAESSVRIRTTRRALQQKKKTDKKKRLPIGTRLFKAPLLISLASRKDDQDDTLPVTFLGFLYFDAPSTYAPPPPSLSQTRTRAARKGANKAQRINGNRAHCTTDYGEQDEKNKTKQANDSFARFPIKTLGRFR